MDVDELLPNLKSSLNKPATYTAEDTWLKFLLNSAVVSAKEAIGKDPDFYSDDQADYLPSLQLYIIELAHDSYLNRGSSTDVDLFDNAGSTGLATQLKAVYAGFEADKEANNATT